ncbi:MAG: type III secretion system chaperone [Planctomycetota bacterium]|nr:type III secretion system chaperone [Planctomycetota bacterium]
MSAQNEGLFSEESLTAAAEKFLETLSRKWQLPAQTFAGGPCLIDFGGGNILALYPQLEGLRSLIMHTQIGVIPLRTPAAGQFQLEALEANNAWSRTQGATLGIDGEDGSVGLWQRFVLPAASEEEITDAVTAFLGTAEFWRDILKSRGGQPAYLDQSSPADAGADFQNFVKA